MADRVLFLSHDLFSIGGIQRLSRHAVRALGDSLPAGGLDICSYRPPTAGGFASDMAANVVGAGTTLRQRRAFARDVVERARSRQPSLIVCDHVRLAPLARAAARAARGSYAVVVHGIEVWTPLPPRQRRALVHADAVVSVCRFTARHISSRYARVASRVTVVGGCVDADEFTPGVPDKTRRAALGADPVVLTVSRLAPGRPKGHEHLFEAMAELDAAGLRLTYLIAGDGPDRARLEKVAERLGVRGSVVFLGAVPDEELPALYRLCDVFVLASGFHIGWRRAQGEAMGLVSLEAQACGRPVVTSKLDGSAEAIVDGETGLLVDPHDPADIARALRTLLADPERRARMGQAARRFAVERYSPGAFSDRIRAALAPWLPELTSAYDDAPLESVAAMTRVLYVNHTATLSGGERSLLELIDALPSEVSASLASPEGPLADAARELGVPTLRINAFAAGFESNPLRMPLTLLRFVRAAWTLRRVLTDAAPDVVHANSVRAGLLAIAAAGRSGPPVLVHVRDCLPANRASHLIRKLICSRGMLVLANSRYTASRFAAETRVVYPSIDIARFDPARISREAARRRLGLGDDEPVLGVVGQLTAWKGQLDAIRALCEVRRSVPQAMLLIAGSVKFDSSRFDNPAYEDSLHEEAERRGVSHAVRFLGERFDIPELLRALDLLLVPSWEEPLGRVVLEGMAMGLPVLATCVGGPSEVIEDGVDGVLLPPREPARWAAVAESLLADTEARDALGRAARKKAIAGFGLEPPIDAALDAYEAVLGERRHQGAGRPLARAAGEAL